ncbi:MAG: glycosyltransferase [Candidatus Methanoperedens sp.]|nr:glycosyltransferase [Candidatus Methanoperedens sp.]
MERKISVVIPVKNEERKIGQCLDAVFNQTLQPFEVIVVDGHSTDATEECAIKFPVRVIFEDYGTVGGARQIGVENSKGEFVAFTDADCIPERNWLENLVKGFDNGIIGVGGGIKNIGDGLWEKSIALALDSFLGSANSVQDRVFKDKRYVKSISGCNSMYRKKDLIDLGGFNVRLSFNEETELNSRLSKFGKLLYIPNAIVLHNQDRNLREFVMRIYKFGKSRGNTRLWDIQVIPPIMGFIIFLLLFLSIKLFLFMILLYVLTLLYFDAIIFTRSKKIKYLFSVPIIFILEHASYTLGFWRGITQSRRM